MAKTVISVFSGITSVGVTVTDWVKNVDFFILTANIAPDEFIENDTILEIDTIAETGQIKGVPIPSEYTSTSAVLYVPQEITRSGLPVRLALLVTEPHQLQVLAIQFFDDFQQFVKTKLEEIEAQIKAACNGGSLPITPFPTMLP